jgi:hypothetical protein
MTQENEMILVIGEGNYTNLLRLIQLHEWLNDGTGLSEEDYDEYENLIESLNEILPLH